ncbi:MAG: nucleoside deaminase [Vulcanimicrobiota bacterium]
MGYDEQNYGDIPPELLEKLRDIVSPQVSSAGRAARVRSAQQPQRVRATTEDGRFLRLAIREAKKALSQGGLPVGCLLVRGGTLLGQGHDRRLQDPDPLGYAELACLRSAGRLGSYRDTVLYTTLMPDYLGAGAVVQFKIPRVVVGNPTMFLSVREFLEAHQVEVSAEPSPECIQLAQDFMGAHPELKHLFGWD